jgi:hypothetical protein
VHNTKRLLCDIILLNVHSYIVIGAIDRSVYGETKWAIRELVVRV